jgi:hypothetical protein
LLLDYAFIYRDSDREFPPAVKTHHSQHSIRSTQTSNVYPSNV